MRYTVSDAIERYCEELAPNGIRRTHLARWNQELGHLRLHNVSHFDIDETLQSWKTRKAKDGSPCFQPATLNRHRNSLSVVFETARSWGWVTVNPCHSAKSYKEPPGRLRVLSEDEKERLFVACRESSCEFLYVIVLLALSTGMRKGEIVQLKWDDIDLKQGTVQLEKNKKGQGRTVLVRGPALQVLKKYAKSCRGDSDYLFPGRRKGKVTSSPKDRPFSIRKPWDEALRVARIKNFRFHDLRHTSAGYLAMHGAGIHEIKEALGHKTTDAVERYLPLIKPNVAHIIEKMNRKMFGKNRAFDEG